MEKKSTSLLDVMRVPVHGDSSAAVVHVGNVANANEIACDVLVVGGGLGGVAAALAAARRGRTVHLTEETDWIGGQLTAQGVSALDEHDWIERSGGTASYYRLRQGIRDHYRPLAARLGGEPYFNPGNCWVSRVACEPRVALAAMMTLLETYTRSGRITLHLRTKAAAASVRDDVVVSVTTVGLESRKCTRFLPVFVLDATELGDVLPLVDAEYVVGAESRSETSEPLAQHQSSKPECVQSLTYVFGLERWPEGENHIIERPPRYEYFRASQPYELTIDVHGGEIYGEESGRLAFKVLERMPGTKGGLWTYRRILDASQFESGFDRDLSIINWPGNDYREKSIIDAPPEESAAALQDAKLASLGFLYWLQTEAPVEGKRIGARELALRADVMGTSDGLAKHPYIRESRRIRARTTVVEQNVSVEFQEGPTAAVFEDSVGVGWYPIDIHPSSPEDAGVSTRTRPFQIPLGALIPVRIKNLIASAKNIGTTHITNGCFRLHPVEWNVGEAAGALAAFCLDRGELPASVHRDEELRSEFQQSLIAEGVPSAWTVDSR